MSLQSASNKNETAYQQERINLQKTLCAMRWIALMTDQREAAQSITENIEFVEDHV